MTGTLSRHFLFGVTILMVQLFFLIPNSLCGQTDYLFSKPNFRDVLISCKDVEFLTNRTLVEFSGSKYEGYYDFMGNLNKLDRDIPLGDFKVTYTYSVKEGSENCMLGMTYLTQDKNSSTYFTFSFMLSQSGELHFFSGIPVKYEAPFAEKNFTIEPCPSLKKGFALNEVSVVRESRNWYLLVNTDTVKKVVEPAYKVPNSEQLSFNPAPLLHYNSNVLLRKGKQKLEFYKCSQTFYPISSEIEAISTLLVNLTGNYTLTPDCKTGSTSYCFNIRVIYEREGMDHKVLISGITVEPRHYYLRKDKVFNNWYCDMNENDVLVSNGEKYNIRRLYFYPSKHSSSISFNVQRREAKDGGVYLFDCDFRGSIIR